MSYGKENKEVSFTLAYGYHGNIYKKNISYRNESVNYSLKSRRTKNTHNSLRSVSLLVSHP